MRSRLLLVGASLFLAATGAAAQTSPSAAPAKPTLGVVAFTNAAMVNHEAWESQRQGIAELVTTMLRYHPSVDVLEREQLLPLLKEQDLGASGRVDAASAARIGKLLGARYMLLGTISVDVRNRMRLAARAVDVETSKILSGEIVDGDADDVMVLVDKLTERLLASLSLPPLPPRGDPGSSPEDTSAPSLAVSKTPIREPAVTVTGSTAVASTAVASTTVASRTVAGNAPGSRVRITRTARALNPPKAGKAGYQALRLVSQALQAEEERKVEEAVGLYRQALMVQPDLVSARDRLARLRTQ